MAASAAVRQVAPQLVLATPKHAAAIAELAARTLPEAWSAASFARVLERDGARVWVVEADGCVVGHLLAACIADEADLLSVAVDPDWRRRGLGRLLLDACLGELRTDGVRRLTLEVREGNHAARALYASCGLTAVGERKHYYGDGKAAVLYGIEL